MFLVTEMGNPTVHRLKRSDGLRESLLVPGSLDTVHRRTFPGHLPENPLDLPGSGATCTPSKRWLFRSTLTGRSWAEQPSLYLEARMGNAESTSSGVLPDGLLMVLRQLAETVKHGRRVTFQIGDTKLNGYLAGIDATHYFVLVPEGEQVRSLFVAREASPIFEVHPEPTYQYEPQRQNMERIIGKFRGAIVNRILVPGDSDARKAG